MNGLPPPHVIKALGGFDLDPCAPIVRPWDTAKQHFTINDMGLMKDWQGRIWLNPPYGDETQHWLGKLRLHGNGIALIFSRTDTAWFQEYVFKAADALLFLKGRLRFHHVTGEQAKDSAGAPSVLIAYGQNNAALLERCGLAGSYIKLQ